MRIYATERQLLYVAATRARDRLLISGVRPASEFVGLATAIATTTGMYLIYEFMHFCCHVDENVFVRHCPFVNTLRRHHTAHHNARLMMEVNMNLTFPIADWLFGTSDLNRGLVGTLLALSKEELARNAEAAGRGRRGRQWARIRARSGKLRGKNAERCQSRGPCCYASRRAAAGLLERLAESSSARPCLWSRRCGSFPRLVQRKAAREPSN